MIIIKDKSVNNLYVTNNTVNEVFLGKNLIYPEYPEPEVTTLTYRTESSNQKVLIANKQQYFSKIVIDGVEQNLTSDKLYYTFASRGTHNVPIQFKKNSKSLAWVFATCENLISYSSNILNNLPNLNDATAIFDHCSGITSIPSSLFKNCPLITNFSYIFNECPLLTTIPSGLFDINTKATSFYNSFNNCYGLTSIPRNLFTNNYLVTNFYGIFGGCYRLAGTVPYDNGSGTSTPLYQRSTGVNGYAKVTSYNRSFERCSALSDYSSIPSDWK